MKKILWVSRYNPIESQLRELRRLFGHDAQVDHFSQPYSRASQILSVYRKNYYDEMVIIAPLSVCKTLSSYGIKPLYSEMEQVPKGSSLAELEIFGSKEQLAGVKRYYRFIKFKRIERIELVFSELDS